jgi:predicted dehydrogenase
MTKPLDIIILGAGSRGTHFGDYFAANPDKGRIVGVAEPRPFWREQMVQKHQIPTEHVFTSWEQAAAKSKFADAVIIATQDRMHSAPSVAFADLGYPIMLEKPMATTKEACHTIVEAILRNKVVFAVCHCLRYTPDTQRVKHMIDSGKIGQVVNVLRLEPVGYWHQAHSFVRGQWANSKKSSPMLLAKSCHDIDWIAYIMGGHCEAVSSFGSLSHFTEDHKPAGAGRRCIDCHVENECPYSAKRFYMSRLMAKDHSWPLDVITSEFTPEGVTDALAQGPYGRCVYECDNDVVDNQVVNMMFDGGRTASLTMTAFCEHGGRKTHIFGTQGQLYIDASKIEHYDFLTQKKEVICLEDIDHSITAGHGGGDYALADAFVEAVRTHDQSKVLSGPLETLHSHNIVFCAETARNLGTVVRVKKEEGRPKRKIRDIALAAKLAAHTQQQTDNFSII